MRSKSLLAAVTVTAALSLTACQSSTDAASGGSGGGSSDGEIGVGYFQSATLGPEVIVAGNPSLADEIDGEFKLTPIDSGVAGLAELRGGAFPFVSGVGNPPVVGAIATDTKLKVIYAEYYDAAQLIVPASIETNDDLRGKKVGALQGSSEDFEIRGWLESQGLTDDVEVVGFPSEAAISAAYKAEQIDAGYVEIAQAIDLKENAGGREVVNAEEVAELGYPSINVLAVTDEYAEANPEVVQQVVCGVMKAQTALTGPDADTFISTAAGLTGADPEAAVPATKVLPFVDAADQTAIFDGSAPGGGLAGAYELTGQFLVDQGRVDTAPTAEQIADHIDGSYVEKALADGCDQ